MKTLIKLTLAFLVLASFLLQSCSQSTETVSTAKFENLTVAELELISEFDQSGEYYFQHLNYMTEVLSNGDILLNDREGSFVIQVNSSGDFVRLISRQGNGPGEVQDPQHIELIDENSLLIVDDQRSRIIRKTLDSSVNDEFTPPQVQTSRVDEAHPTIDPDIISLHWFDFSALLNSEIEPLTRFSSFNLNTTQILDNVEYPGKTYATLLSESGQPRGATPVPYTPELLYDYSEDKIELYAFWPENFDIAVLNPIQFDTVRTIPVRIPSELLTVPERDSLEEEFNPEYWELVEELLPEQKVPADKMIIDPQNKIWLKLTLQSDHQEWIVLDQTGSPELRVQFPKEGMVTHISDAHIGFRADDHLFSLYRLKE